MPKGEGFGDAGQAWALEETFKLDTTGQSEQLKKLANKLPGCLKDWACLASGDKEYWSQLCDWKLTVDQRLKQKKRINLSPTDTFLLSEVERFMRQGTKPPKEQFTLASFRHAGELLLPANTEPLSVESLSA